MGDQGFLCMDVPEDYGGMARGFSLFRDSFRRAGQNHHAGWPRLSTAM